VAASAAVATAAIVFNVMDLNIYPPTRFDNVLFGKKFQILIGSK
jgi:hypothetical protein